MSHVDLTAGQILQEANEIYSQVTDVANQDSNIDNALEMMEEVGDAAGGFKTESLTPTETRLLTMNMRAIAGPDFMNRFSIKMEDGLNPTQTSLIFESIKQLMRDFWRALKSSFNAVWAKLKTWYIAISSASVTLVKKANRIKSKADSMSGVPKEKRFDFTSADYVHVGGKVDSAKYRAGLKVVKDILEDMLNVRTTKEVENFIDAADDAMESFIKSKEALTMDTSWLKRFSSIYTPVVKVKTTEVTDAKMKRNFATDEDSKFKVTETLPGSYAVLFSELKENSNLPVHDAMGKIYGKLIKADEKELGNSVSAEVLLPSQISDICDTIVDINEQITYYEKAWERRDKFMNGVLNRLEKSIDRIDNDLDGEDEDAQATVYKKSVRAILKAIKRSNTFNAAMINYVVRVSSGGLNYCQASLAFYE